MTKTNLTPEELAELSAARDALADAKAANTSSLGALRDAEMVHWHAQKDHRKAMLEVTSARTRLAHLEQRVAENNRARWEAEKASR